MTADRHHRIARQVLLLDGCRDAEAGALQAALSARFHADWLPVLDRVLSRLGDPQRVLRIDRLEIDLGAVAPNDLLAPAAGEGGTTPLLDHLEARLQQCLQAALDSAFAVDTDRELLACFLHGGCLPWWADAAEPRAVVRAIDALAGAPAAVWRGLLAGPDGQPAPATLRRLVAEAGPPRLAGLLARWRAAAGADDWPAALLPAWETLLARTAGALAQPLPAWRDAWWQAALAEALWRAEAASGAASGAWWPAVLARWLRAAGVDLAAARQALRSALDQPDAAADWPPALWQALARPPELPEPHAAPAGRLGEALDRLAATADATASTGAEATAAALQGLRRTWPGPWTQLPAALQRRLADALGQGGAAVAAALQAALPPLLAAAGADRATQADAAALAALARRWAEALDRPLHRPAAARLAAARVAAPAAADAPPVEALYLANAGLVLLWPFISRFAGRLGLLVEGTPARFHDPAAAARAALLLQRAIAGWPEAGAAAPEHLLPLNKLLCGLPLAAPLPPIEPLTEAEHDEAEALLRAAIAQAPILRNQSSSGFRVSFGLRPGQLVARDGHWLLRVERQAWDVVLDRLPWGFGIVRLPWMPRLLQVQW